jgi:hypothetical protein
MIGLVANAKIGKLGVQSGELIFQISVADFCSIAGSLELGVGTLILRQERLQIELLLVGFVKSVAVRL